jgi:hypothetical protein
MDEKNILALARDVYPLLVPLTRTKRGKMSYTDVCERLEVGWHGLHPESQFLANALGLIVRRCRARGLPALSALVVHKNGDRMPGNGYFPAAHPEVNDPEMQRIEWAKEFELAHRADYPPRLDDLV